MNCSKNSSTYEDSADSFSKNSELEADQDLKV